MHVGVASKTTGLRLTFVTTIELRFSDKGWTVAHVASQESICWIGIATANVTRDCITASAIMALILVATAAEKRVPLHK